MAEGAQNKPALALFFGRSWPTTLFAAAASAASGEAKSGHRTMTVSVPDSVLDAFGPLKGIFVKQAVDLLELFVGWEQCNK